MFELLAACVLVLTGTGGVQQASAPQRIHLKHADARALIAKLKVPAGVSELSVNFNENTIELRGEKSAVVSAWEQIVDADNPPRPYVLRWRVLERVVDAAGASSEHLVGSPFATTLEGYPTTIGFSQGDDRGYSLEATVKRVDDKQVKLDASVKLKVSSFGAKLADDKSLTVPLGETVKLFGVTECADEAVRKAVWRGERPATKTPHRAYYIEVVAGSGN